MVKKGGDHEHTMVKKGGDQAHTMVKKGEDPCTHRGQYWVELVRDDGGID
jgi:hypothetical protein